jgi:hypothetical protein
MGKKVVVWVVGMLRLSHISTDRFRTCVTLALEIPRCRARSALDLIPFVPIRAFHCLARSIASNLDCDRGLRCGLAVPNVGFRVNMMDCRFLCV